MCLHAIDDIADMFKTKDLDAEIFPGTTYREYISTMALHAFSAGFGNAELLERFIGHQVIRDAASKAAGLGYTDRGAAAFYTRAIARWESEQRRRELDAIFAKAATVAAQPAVRARFDLAMAA